MVEKFVCPSCKKKHESKEPVCEYCGENLEEAIEAYERKMEPIEFYEEILAAGKKRRRHQRRERRRRRWRRSWF